MRQKSKVFLSVITCVLSVYIATACRQRVNHNDADAKGSADQSDQMELGLGLKRHSLEGPFSKQEDLFVQGLAKQILSRITTFRDAHPKAHACVYNAALTVNENLDPSLRTGVFTIPNRSIPAIVRFSSGSSKPNADDRERGSHGMAVKLMLTDAELDQVADIPGEEFHTRSDTPVDLKGPNGRAVTARDLYKTFDVISIDGLSEFVVNDLAAYPAFLKAAATGNFGEYIGSLPVKHRPIIALLLGKLATMQVTNLLNERYNSWVPYAFDADRAVKYSFVPCSNLGNAAFSSAVANNFLGERLRSDLVKKDGCFKLVAQFHDDSMEDVIENAAYPWGSPWSRKYVELATLTIPPKFTSESFCQGLSFNPAHALPNQRGIGATQRARRFIYAAIAKTRNSNTERTTAE